MWRARLRRPGILRSRYSRDADHLRRLLEEVGLPDAGALSDAQAHALAHLNYFGLRAGLSAQDSLKGLTAAAQAMRAHERG